MKKRKGVVRKDTIRGKIKTVVVVVIVIIILLIITMITATTIVMTMKSGREENINEKSARNIT